MSQYSDAVSALKKLIADATALVAESEKKADMVTTLAQERTRGYPTLASAISEYIAVADGHVASSLLYKRNPAYKASQVVRDYSKLRREAIERQKIAEELVKYYEELAPFLLEYKNEITEMVLPPEAVQNYNEEEIADEATRFLTLAEYRQLTPAERNQRALDRYLQYTKNNMHIGRLYEMYVGWLFEKEGYSVTYFGIQEGCEDLGRDLICKNSEETVIVQCKCWSKFKRLHENVVFQLYGTLHAYRKEHPHERVRAEFITSTQLSDTARSFLKLLVVDVRENLALDTNFPMIKCNVSKATGSKIYHLPFDQQYTRVIIEPHKGEKIVQTVAEAEASGFRRAKRHFNN
jgi:Restriction endonuclease